MNTLFVEFRCLTEDRPALLAVLQGLKPIDFLWLDDPPAPPFHEQQMPRRLPYTTVKATFSDPDMAAGVMTALKDATLLYPEFVVMRHWEKPGGPFVMQMLDGRREWHQLTP